MRQKEQNAEGADRWRLAENLIEVSRVDTVYGDVYRQRARELLSEALSEADYGVMKVMQTEAVNLPNQIRMAMEQENWGQVRELSARLKSLKRTLDEKSLLWELGEKLYAQMIISIDPFSPGLKELSEATASGSLEEIRNRETLRLERLVETDEPWQAFYAARAKALRGLSLATRGKSWETGRSEAQLQQEALDVLEKGNFEKLEALAENLMEEGRLWGAFAPPGASCRVCRN